MLAGDIFDYARKYQRMPVLLSLRYGDTGKATHRHPVWASLSVLMNLINNLDVRITPFRGKTLIFDDSDLNRIIRRNLIVVEP
jgi:hypothetical protein